MVREAIVSCEVSTQFLMYTQTNTLDKKKEASAGSGGTAVHALAGGGNQSLLTASAACLGERRVPQPLKVTLTMHTLFPPKPKKNPQSPDLPKKSVTRLGNKGIKYIMGRPPFLFSKGPLKMRLMAALTIASISLTIGYNALADLVPPNRGPEIHYQAPTSSHRTPPAIKRLRDTVLTVDVQWPSAVGPQLADDARTTLMAMINDPEPETRIQGLLGLLKAEVPEIMNLLIRALDDPAPEVRGVALRTLAERDTLRLTHELIERLSSNDEATRKAAEQALPELKEHLENPMLDLLQAPDTEPGTRRVLARALGTMASTKAIEALSQVAVGHDRTLTHEATWALAQIASPEALPALQESSRHPNAGVRAAALSGLARIGGPAALSAIEAMALNPSESNRHTRLRAVHYIGLMGADSSVETLIKVMNRYPETRDTAAAALTRITGLNFGNSPRAWTQWFVERKKAREKAQQQQSNGPLSTFSNPRAAPSPPPQQDATPEKRQSGQ